MAFLSLSLIHVFSPLDPRLLVRLPNGLLFNFYGFTENSFDRGITRLEIREFKENRFVG